MTNEFSLHWFRQDLRLSDNPSLNYLSQKYKRIVCVFIYDEVNCNRKIGSASKTWLHYSLLYLNNKLNNNLLILTSTARDLVNIDKSKINELLQKVEANLNNQSTDKERYITSYKLETLKEIS